MGCRWINLLTMIWKTLNTDPRIVHLFTIQREFFKWNVWNIFTYKSNIMMTYDLIQWLNWYILNHLRCKSLLEHLLCSGIQCHQQFGVPLVTLPQDLPDHSSRVSILNIGILKQLVIIVYIKPTCGHFVRFIGRTQSDTKWVNNITVTKSEFDCFWFWSSN